MSGDPLGLLSELLRTREDELPEPLRQRVRELLPHLEEQLALARQQRERAERHLAQAARLAEFGAVAASVLHELNQPLLGIKGFADLLREALAREQIERARELTEEIRTQARRMHELQRRASNFLRADGEARQARLESCLEQALAMFAHRLRKQKVEIRQQLEPELPPVAMSPLHLVSVLANLVGNAFDALTDGGLLLVEARRRDGQIQVWVGNSGPALPEAEAAKIFEPFYTSKGESGTGLGLFIARRLAELAGGSLELVPAAGTPWAQEVTTVFYLRLPLFVAEAAPAPPEPKVKGGERLPVAGTINQRLLEFIKTMPVSQRVLVVDDEPVVHRVLGEYLAGRNILCDCCHLAEEALERLQADSYAVVVADKNLPGSDGLQLLRQVKESWPAVEVVMITGYASVESALEALAAGAFDYVPKPFPSLEHVGNKITGALARHQFEVRVTGLIGFLSDTCKQLLRELDPGTQRQAVQALQQALHQGEDEAQQQVLVCGPTSMVNSVRQLGYPTQAGENLEQCQQVLRDKAAAMVVYVEAEGQPAAAQAVATIQQLDPDAAVLVVARESSLKALVEAIGMGVGDYLVRPLEGREFLAPRLERLHTRQRRVRRYRRVMQALRKLNIDLARELGLGD